MKERKKCDHDMTGGCVDSALWKFILHIVYNIKLTRNFLTKFCYSARRLSGNVAIPLCLKFEAPASA